MPNAKTKAWISLAVSLSVMAAAIFLCAGTTDYWQAWVYLAVAALSSIPLTLLITESPRLLEARRKAGPGAEKRPQLAALVRALDRTIELAKNGRVARVGLPRIGFLAARSALTAADTSSGSGALRQPLTGT